MISENRNMVFGDIVQDLSVNDCCTRNDLAELTVGQLRL